MLLSQVLASTSRGKSMICKHRFFMQMPCNILWLVACSVVNRSFEGFF